MVLCIFNNNKKKNVLFIKIEVAFIQLINKTSHDCDPLVEIV